MAKKKAKKKVVKKTAKKRTKKKTARKKQHDPLHQLRTLHAKKLEIMRDVPTIPCSAIAKDRYGLMYAHTQAEKIFELFSKKCREKFLVIRMVECNISSIKYPDIDRGLEKDENVSIDGVLAECKFEIRDCESGESETFCGAGLGDNAVWSASSAQTVAMKQAVIMYFFSSWPQPTSFCEVIKKELAQLKGEDFYQAIKKILPEKLPEPMTGSQAERELLEYFGGPIKKSQKKT